MKHYLFALLLLPIAVSCGTSKNASSSQSSKEDLLNPDLSAIEYGSGDGKTAETAILIKNAKNEMDGVASEYAYLDEHYGTRNKDWKLLQQHTSVLNKRRYDVLNIQLLPSNETQEIYFDITDFFGKW